MRIQFAETKTDLSSYQRSGVTNFETRASIMTFFVIGIGGLGSLSAGWLADRWGRNYTTMLSMAISDTAAVTIGLFFGGSPILVTAIALIWDFSIVADPGQFSIAISQSKE